MKMQLGNKQLLILKMGLTPTGVPRDFFGKQYGKKAQHECENLQMYGLIRKNPAGGTSFVTTAFGEAEVKKYDERRAKEVELNEDF